MANLKEIRKRITSVKSTQKISRAMKMVAGARLNKAQVRITSMRPYAVEIDSVLRRVVDSAQQAQVESGDGGGELEHPLLAQRPEKNILVVVITSDRGLCGSFNSSINKAVERYWHEQEDADKTVQLGLIGRKGRDYFRRRNAPVFQVFDSVWDNLSVETAGELAQQLVKPFLAGEADSIYLVYNEFKSAMTQTVTFHPLFPLQASISEIESSDVAAVTEYMFEPDRTALLDRLVPMYVEITILRALYESVASELGARMTAMDAATKNATEMIAELTLKYNRVRQAAITTEILEIIGGAEALNA